MSSVVVGLIIILIMFIVIREMLHTFDHKSMISKTHHGKHRNILLAVLLFTSVKIIDHISTSIMTQLLSVFTLLLLVYAITKHLKEERTGTCK